MNKMIKTWFTITMAASAGAALGLLLSPKKKIKEKKTAKPAEQKT